MVDETSTRRTDATVAAERLRLEILSGRVAPGSKLKLASLAERYAMSRGPLREAATRLAAEGLVTIEDQKGFRVTAISRADLLDLTATRKRIELLALRDSIIHGDLGWEGRVMAARHVLDRVTGEDPANAFSDRHREFHEVLVSACPSSYLLRFREQLYALTERYRNLARQGHRRVRDARDVSAEHQAIAEAAVARRADEACALLGEHLSRTAQVLIEAYPELFGAP